MSSQAVQQVISNLLISHIELCSEDSPDIQPYSYARQVEKCVVPLGKELTDIQNAYIRVLENFAGRLIRFRVLAQREIPTLTKYQIILARDQFRKNPPSHLVGAQQGAIEGDFALCISLYHGYELLLQMGMRSLYIFLRGIMDGSKGMTRAKNELGRNEDFMMLYSQLENMFVDMPLTSANGSTKPGSEKKKQFIYSHPKLKKLEDVVVEHFQTWRASRGSTLVSLNDGVPEGKPADTRVMIFSSFRDSVQEIAEMLSRHHPAVRVMTFVGHSVGKSTKGFTQKEQLAVVKHFRDGGYNTLVSTCVGEEGLDIGEVDLIICFDAQKSPIRLVQRMGRTGRKRQGRIVVILSEGREERTYNQSQSKRRNLLKTISENKGFHLYQHSPRMIPEGITPRMHRMLITPAECEPHASGPSMKEQRSHALLQARLPCFTGTGAKHVNSTEGWCLTADEYEKWNRLYRIETSGGIKKPVMPEGRFETLEDEEKKTELQTNEVYELSLTEWRLWQNRPFPTHLVGHSDRCCNFISIMEMIEQMRQEEGECSYELRLQPNFHWEDVDDTSMFLRRESCYRTAGAQKSSSPRKMVVNASQAKQGSSSLEELDADCVSLFKATSFKTGKRPQGLKVESKALAKEGGSPLDHSSASSGRSGEDADGKILPGENQGCLDQFTCTKSVANPKGAGELLPAAQESWDRHSVDSGYGCFTEDNSLLSSSMFYLPAPDPDAFLLSATCADGDSSCGEDMMLSVARLLSQSPPSLNELLELEKESENEARQLDLHVEVFPEKLKTFSEFQNSSKPSRNTPEITDSRKRCSPSNCPLETGSSSEAFFRKPNAELNWDEIFDLDDEEQVGIQGGNLPVANHGPASLRNDGGGGHGGSSCKGYVGNMRIDEDVSVLLFEGDRFSECGSPSSGKEGALSPDVCSQANTPANKIRTAKQQSSNEFISTSHTDLVDPTIIPSDGTLEVASNLDRFRKPEPQSHTSQDLFSVNFDLGFSVQALEDETSEQVSTVEDGRSRVAEDTCPTGNRARKSPLLWANGYLDRTKFSTPLRLQNQTSNLAETENVVLAASPLTPAGEKLCHSPDAAKSAFSTPTGRQAVCAQVPRGASMSSLFRNRQASLPVPPAGKANPSTVKRDLAMSAFSIEGLVSHEPGNGENRKQDGSNVLSAEGTSSEEEIGFLRKNKRKRNILTSPIMNNCDSESPVCAIRKRRCPTIALDSSSDDSTDFCEKSNQVLGRGKSCRKRPGRRVERQKKGARARIQASASHPDAVRQFIDEEAELSAEGAMEVSSDEWVGSGDELGSSLMQFLNDETQITQALNESEMQAVYLTSVRSPAVRHARRQMGPRRQNPVAVFSQVPEQDESYLADSFCVMEEEEENEEVGPKSSSGEDEELCVNFDLLQEDSFVNGRKQYLTRRRKRLKGALLERNKGPALPQKKPSRIRVLGDSSEDEKEARVEMPMGLRAPPSTGTGTGSRFGPSSASECSPRCRAPPAKTLIQPSRGSRAQMPLASEAPLPEELGVPPPREDRNKPGLPGEDLQLEEPPGAGGRPSASLRKQAPLPILADTREVSSGPGVISTLKAVHGVRVQVCPLGSCDYVVSHRLAVERRSEAELLSGAQRGQLAQRVQRLRSTFDRVCLIVEKARGREGEAWRGPRRTKCFDSLLAELLQAGIRVLFSSCQEETAGLLRELASLEQRKRAAICVPTEVEGPGLEALRFCLSIPCVGYPAALALSHGFASLRELANSSPGEMVACSRVTLQQAKEVHRYLRYAFNAHLLPEKIT
ncbi:hypothetical protein lerEdw1_007545 [Lerista edwardsae]|nr:hypothetical protein lerEdw1_007545 [Lerista edwardsae]